MEKKKIVLATFLAGVISIAIKNGSLSSEWMSKSQAELESIGKELYSTVDGYLQQVLIESRYVTAQAVVWVYGCADKT